MGDPATPPPAIAIALVEDAASAVPPGRIELPIAVPSTQQCAASPTEEIIVCAPDSAAYRMGRLPDQPAQALPRAELRLSGKAAVAAQLQAGSLGHLATNRAMVTVRVAF